MISFSSSKVGFIIIAALSLAGTVQSAYYMTTRSRPSTTMMIPKMTRPSLFSRDVAQVVREIDAMIDSIAVNNGFEDIMLYDPLMTPMRLKRQYFLPSFPDASPFASNILKQTYEITQDDKQIQIKINMPGVDVSNIKLEVYKENRLLKIIGKSQREDNGITVDSSFERFFSLNPNIDESGIAAQMDKDGVLLITAPKRDIPEDNVQRIDIVDTGSRLEAGGEVDESEEANEPTPSDLVEEKTDAGVGDGIIDLDVE